jgi:hypothetical protein
MLQILCIFTFLRIKAHSDCSIRRIYDAAYGVFRRDAAKLRTADAYSNQIGHHFCGMGFNDEAM